MNLTKPLLLCSLALIQSLAIGSEKSMNQALQDWEQEKQEYQAAIKYAKSDEERTELIKQAPTGNATAIALWKSISSRVGYKEIEIEDESPAERFRKKKNKRIPIYGFEQAWSTPAVCWLIRNPATIPSLSPGGDASKIAKVLLNSITNTHFDKPLVAEICPTLATLNKVSVYDSLEKIYMRNPSDKARACAAMAMSIMLSNPLIRSQEGSEQMAEAKRIYYIKSALNLAPEKCMFGSISLDEVALEQLYFIKNLSKGSIPPAITLSTVDERQVQLPLINQAQMFFFWLPGDTESTQLIKRCKSLSEKYPSIKIIAIAPEIGREELRQYYVADTIDYPTFIDPKNQASHAYRISSHPYVIFIDENSKLLYRGKADLNLQASISQYITSLQKQREDGQEALPAQDSVIPEPLRTEQETSQAPALRDIPEM